MIGISYYSVLFFTKQFNAYRERSASFAEYFLLTETFQKDLQESDFMTDSANTWVMHRIEGKIMYEITNKHIVRTTAENLDTFFLSKAEILRSAGSYSGDIEAVSVKVNINKAVVEKQIMKYYSAEQLMKREKLLNE